LTRRVRHECVRAVAALTVVACGQSSHHRVALQVIGEPLTPTQSELLSSIAYRADDGDWHALDVDSSGEYSFEVASDYAVVALGSNPDGSPLLAELFSTFDDEPTPYLALGNISADVSPPTIPTAPSEPYAVTVSMKQAGAVYGGGSQVGSDAGPWTGMLMVGAGTWDVAAVGSNQMALRHGVRVDGNLTLPTVDLGVEGDALVPVTVTVNSLSSSVVVPAQAAVVLMTPTLDVAVSSAVVGPAQNESGSDVVALLAAPASLLAAGDVQGGVGFEVGQTAFAGFPNNVPVDVEVTVPPSPTVIYSPTPVPTVTWTGPATSVCLGVGGQGAGSPFATLTATSSWIADHGDPTVSVQGVLTHSLTFDTSFPGYGPTLLLGEPLGPGSVAADIIDCTPAATEVGFTSDTAVDPCYKP
jgi:hypothetical protein